MPARRALGAAPGKKSIELRQNEASLAGVGGVPGPERAIGSNVLDALFVGVAPDRGIV